MLREFRGDSHIAAWIAAGLDATEIGLLTELYWGLRCAPTAARGRGRTPSSTPPPSVCEARGLLGGRRVHRRAAGRSARRIEDDTDRQMKPALDALGDDVDELFAILAPWGQAVRDAKGYPAAGPHDLAGASR